MSVAAYTIRYILSPREYEALAKRWQLESKLAPKDVHQSEKHSKTPQLLVRQHIRLFLGVYGAGKTFALLANLRMSGVGDLIPATEVASSVTAVSALYRGVYVLLSRALALRYSGASLESAKKTLVPVAASVVATAGFSLFPAEFRGYIALYTASKAAEYIYNYLDDKGYLAWKPRILGSWLLFPLAMSELFYTLINNPEWSSQSVKTLMLRLRGSYGPVKPESYPADAPWPSDNQWLRSLSEIATLKFPKFRSHIVYRNQKPWPESLKYIEPVLSLAHPGNTTLTGAVLHPNEDSEWQPFIETVLSGYAMSTKWLLPLYFIFGVLRNKRTLTFGVLATAIANALRSATFISMTSATAWAGVGLSQSLLGTKALPKTRFRIIGFMSGLWAFLDQVNGRTRNLYAMRLAILSQYNYIVAQRGGRALVPKGDLLLFGAGLASIFVIFNNAPEAISSPRLRQIFSWIQTGEFHDPAPLPEPKTA